MSSPNPRPWFTLRTRAVCVGLSGALSLLALATLAQPKQVPERSAASQSQIRRASTPKTHAKRSMARVARSRAIAPPKPAPKPAPKPTPKPAAWYQLPADSLTDRVLFRSPDPGYIPQATRVTVMLHGMCDVPDNECPSFSAATQHSWLVCPQASVSCQGGGATWHWKNRVERVEAATARAMQGLAASPAARTLIGFSLGAAAALDVAQRGSERYDALILIASSVSPNPRQLRDHGVKRVVLAAGDFDQTHGHLVREARRLTRAGIDARFMSLGKVGHQFAPDMDAWLGEALSWVEAPVGTP